MSLAKTVFQSPVHMAAFGFGSGLAPFAPVSYTHLDVYKRQLACV